MGRYVVEVRFSPDGEWEMVSDYPSSGEADKMVREIMEDWEYHAVRVRRA